MKTEGAPTLDDALDQAVARYAAANVASAARQKAATSAMPGGNTRTVLYYGPFPIAFTSGAGSTLVSADGDSYTDLLGEFTAGLYGHSNPVILRAIHDALDNGISFGGHNLLEGRLAEAIAGKFPSTDLIRFTNSGTEANLLAIATAVAVTGRKGILVFEGGYHGSVFVFAGESPLNAPYEFVRATYNDVEGTRALLRDKDFAAVIVEPMLGSGGCIPGDPEFLQMLRDETSASGAILIFDEVMTSRLTTGGLQKSLGITPDMTTLGKYLGGGMSFGAFGGRADIMAHFDPTVEGTWQHAGTFNNNVLTMSAGLAAFDLFGPTENADLNARGDRLRADLNTVFDEAGVRMTATGFGSLITIHGMRGPIATPADLSASDQKIKELFFFDMVHAGFWLARRGMIALSLPITDHDCVRFVQATRDFVGEHRTLIL